MRFNKERNPFAMISSSTLLSCCAAIAVVILIVHPSLAQQSIEGIWFNETGKSAIQILSCPEIENSIASAPGYTALCGHIIWLNPDKDEHGQPLKDTLNKDLEKRERLICGLQIIGDLKYQADGSWDKGKIYDPRRGQSFDLSARLLSVDQLEVRGYLGAKFFGKSFVWNRALQNVETCQK